MGRIRSAVATHWRGVLARAPLPTLALAASYGVYSFQTLFVPWYVAIVSAVSYELVYIGLAVARLDEQQRERAARISLGAVLVSIVYNSLSALDAIRPGLFFDRPLWADICLAVVHGLPLAVVAYLVADLLLHAEREQAEPVVSAEQLRTAQDEAARLRSELAERSAELRAAALDVRSVAQSLRDGGASLRTIGAALGVSEKTIRNWTMDVRTNGHGVEG